MNTIHVDVVSAEENIFSGEARMVVLPGESGELGIYPRHTPLISRIRPGSVRIQLPDGKEEFVFVAGGIIEVQPNCVTVLSDTAIRGKDLDEARANEARKLAEESDSALVREELGKLISSKACPCCDGARLREEARHVHLGDSPDSLTLHEINRLPLARAREHLLALKLAGNKAQIAEKVLKEIDSRLRFLLDVGLEYLSLDRSTETLSGGEAQRIRLASQIGSGLTGVMYVLDEPSIGLHQRDNQRLLETLRHLRNLGNTVIVVEHDEDAILSADYVVDIGPGAGVHGGVIVAEGRPEEVIANTASLTADYLS